MRCIDLESLAPALLYFTGSGEFNKNMRTFALKKGYTLNEYGIYKLNQDKTKGAKINVKTEEDVFKLLGMPYIEPNARLATVKFV
jgi:DNA polymerase/3'-5' exonuclease PolX